MISIDIFEIAKWLGALGVIVGVLLGIGRPLAKVLPKLNEYLDQAVHIEQGVRTMLKYRITKISERALQRGWISSFEKTTVKEGYKAYHALDGNGEITILVELALALETRYVSAEDIRNGHETFCDDALDID